MGDGDDKVIQPAGATAVRRFLNLLVANRPGCMYSLRRFDLSRNQFFYTSRYMWTNSMLSSLVWRWY
ncbi:hypothetical protein ZWY2020_022620 [Hordeum vulgare]|nr:hypothetical protein ZWY2020_022620 [Hordeum vulgare]